MQKMQNQKPREDTPPPHSIMTTEVLSPTDNDRASPLPAQASSAIPAAAPTAAGVKKKKPKKKK